MIKWFAANNFDPNLDENNVTKYVTRIHHILRYIVLINKNISETVNKDFLV